MSNGNDTEFNLAQAMLDELREHGWIKGALSNKDGKCMMWAASEVSSSRREKAKIRYKMKYLPMRPYEEIILGWVETPKWSYDVQGISFGEIIRQEQIIMRVIAEQYPERCTPIPMGLHWNMPNLAHIPTFNDHPFTTFEDVERVLEKAAVEIGN
jgi:hypothetical protein